MTLKKEVNQKNNSEKKEITKKILKNILYYTSPTSQYTKKSPGEEYEKIEKEMTGYSTKIKYALKKQKKKFMKK